LIGDMPIPRDAFLSLGTDAVWADLDGEIAILDTAGGLYYGVDAVGARVWEMLQTPMTFGALCTSIMAEFDVDEATCEADMQEFVATLAAERLVRVTGETQ
jgi:hypothetical protein